jgi:hypothetical protein
VRPDGALSGCDGLTHGTFAHTHHRYRLSWRARHQVEPKTSRTSQLDPFHSPLPSAQWTGVHKSPTFFAYSNNYLIDVKFGVIVDVEACRSIPQKLHPIRRPWALLQRGRSRQPPRDRDLNGRQGRPAEHFDPDGLHRSGRTRISALCPVRRPASVPLHQPALRARLRQAQIKVGSKRLSIPVHLTQVSRLVGDWAPSWKTEVISSKRID